MLKHTLLIIAIFAYATIVQGQSDKCDSGQLSGTVLDYAIDIALASYDEVQEIAEEINNSLNEYLANCDQAQLNKGNSANTTALFNVNAVGTVNIRSCAETTCGIVEVSSNGETFAVVEVVDDWYEILLADNSTGFIASWLTVRGPDKTINIYESHTDTELDCVILADVQRASSTDISIIISGNGMDEVVVDIFRPNNSTPEPVWRQLTKTFVDTGDVYYDQVYLSSYWPRGTYQLSLERYGIEKVFGFDLNQTGNTNIFVYCD